MKTLSNAELQDAIRYSTECVKNCLQKSNEYQLHLEQLVALLDEQRRRATDELTLEPMTTTLDRLAFEARAKAPDDYHMSGCWYGGNEAQDGPEWSDWGGGICPVKHQNTVECAFRNGRVSERRAAQLFSWAHCETIRDSDIIAYRDWTAWEKSK